MNQRDNSNLFFVIISISFLSLFLQFQSDQLVFGQAETQSYPTFKYFQDQNFLYSIGVPQNWLEPMLYGSTIIFKNPDQREGVGLTIFQPGKYSLEQFATAKINSITSNGDKVIAHQQTLFSGNPAYQVSSNKYSSLLVSANGVIYDYTIIGDPMSPDLTSIASTFKIYSPQELQQKQQTTNDLNLLAAEVGIRGMQGATDTALKGIWGWSPKLADPYGDPKNPYD